MKKEKKKKLTTNAELNKKFLEKVKSLNKNQNIENIYLDLLHGRNAYLRMRRLESSVFDSSWIDVVEGVLFDLGEIVQNPRQVTKQESYIVPVELAKKTDGESVQHLASHTQYIKEVDKHGNVVPSKILSHSNEDYLFTYENRFIATFIRRLVLFIEKRFEFIQNMFPLHVEDILYVKNNSIVNNEEVEIETKIKVKRESNDDMAYQAKDFIARIEKMREYIFYYYNSSFMRKMKNEKDVRKPILQTNIIRKNVKYHHCFEVFTFIEKFDSLGVNYHVTEDYKIFNEEEMADVNYIMLSDYLSVKSDIEFEEVKRSQKEYKPKIMTSIDDEIFTFGPPLTGTLEFVRVDEPYRNYLNRMQEVHDLPLHPDKYEKLYYKDEYLYKKVYKERFEEIEKLLRRKVREQEDYEKLVQDILRQVEEEERQAEEARLRAIIEDEMRRIEKKRLEMIAQANKDHDEQVRREQERKERLIMLEAERQRRIEEEQEKERIRQEQEAQRLKQEEEEQARKEEARIAMEVEQAWNDIREQEARLLQQRLDEIAEDKRIVHEVEIAKQSIIAHEKNILAMELDRRAAELQEKRRIELEVAVAKDNLIERQKEILEQERQRRLEEAKASEADNTIENSQIAQDSSDSSSEVIANIDNKDAANNEDKAADRSENDTLLDESNKAKNKVARFKKVKILSINGKKVNATLVEETLEDEDVELKAEPTKKVVPVKKAPIKKEPKVEVPQQENKEEFPHISSKKNKGFVVQTSKGYYVSEDNFAMHKLDGHVFMSKEEAVEVQKKVGGKVVKL